MGIASPGPVLLIAAQNLNERRKGAGLVLDALKGVSDRPLNLITLGQGGLKFAKLLARQERTRIRAGTLLSLDMVS